MSRSPAADIQGARRKLVIVFACFMGVMAVGTVVTYVQARPLLEGDTVTVVGTVVDERAGFLGIRNFVRVEYSVQGDDFVADIPVKGNGFPSRGHIRLDPYFYQRGDEVELLVRPNDPSAVRTAQRWTPAVYNWGAVLASGCGVGLMLWAIFSWEERRAAKERSTLSSPSVPPTVVDSPAAIEIRTAAQAFAEGATDIRELWNVVQRNILALTANGPLEGDYRRLMAALRAWERVDEADLAAAVQRTRTVASRLGRT